MAKETVQAIALVRALVKVFVLMVTLESSAKSFTAPLDVRTGRSDIMNFQEVRPSRDIKKGDRRQNEITRTVCGGVLEAGGALAQDNGRRLNPFAVFSYWRNAPGRRAGQVAVS